MCRRRCEGFAAFLLLHSRFGSNFALATALASAVCLFVATMATIGSLLDTASTDADLVIVPCVELGLDPLCRLRNDKIQIWKYTNHTLGMLAHLWVNQDCQVSFQSQWDTTDWHGSWRLDAFGRLFPPPIVDQHIPILE